jgi:uncharacterized protein GlcG (DUF336 family)
VRTTLTSFVLTLLCIVAPVKAEEALIAFRVMSPEMALKLAQAALTECRKRNFQVAVAVVDRSGVLQVALRDRFAGPHTPDTARRKAWTAVSFRTDTLTMAEQTQAGKAQSGVREVTEALMIGGGVPVEAAGSIVGAVGVSGAPGGEQDDACARAGIEAIADKLAF